MTTRIILALIGIVGLTDALPQDGIPRFDIGG